MMTQTMMTPERNEAIMASAGTGKTYNLSMRYIRLLLSGVRPSAIAALTFSNKAAGEILESIITRFCELISDPEKLQDAKNEGDLPECITRNMLLDQLRILLSGPDRPNISTLDSFFFQIVRAFPQECGINGAITMLNEKDERPRVRALMRTLSSMDDAGRRELQQMIKLASYGNEERSLMWVMKDFLKTYYTFYREAGASYLWGNPADIWDSYDHKFVLTACELEMLEADGDALISAIADMTDAAQESLLKKWNKLCTSAKDYINSRTGDFDDGDFSQWFSSMDMLLNPQNMPESVFSYRRKNYVLSRDFMKIAAKVLLHLITCEFEYMIERTKALFNLMATFDRTYSETVRQAGQLTFQDIPLLIAGKSDAYRAILEERLDAQIDHYLLDEFQDTANLQWSILKDLADEIVRHESTGRYRSFFMVGDIKQSIYQWRSGNPRLFGMICSDYEFQKQGPGDPPPQNLKRSLTSSFRSSPPVIQAVNDVFFHHAASIPDDTLREAVKRLDFEEHSSDEKKAAKQPGCVMMLSTQNGMDRKAEIISRILREIDPFRRKKPLSVGILIHQNKTAVALKEALARCAPDLPVTLDGEINAEESMAFTVYRQLLRHGAHPGDTMAIGFLSMLPGGMNGLRDSVFPEKAGSDESLSACVRNMVADHGFSRLTEQFSAAYSDLKPFDQVRLQVVRKAAVAADRESFRSIDDYLDFLQLHADVQASTRKTVQIMTIHKSKGLDFDIVFLPDNSKAPGSRDSIVKARDYNHFAVKKDANGIHPEFLSCVPVKVAAELIPGFAEYQQQEDRDACYENCCKLYVAMTRARNAMYILNDAGPDKEHTPYYDDLLRWGLANRPDSLTQPDEAEKFVKKILPETVSEIVLEYAAGEPFWYRSGKTEQPEETAGSACKTTVRQCPVLLRNDGGKAAKVVTPSGTHSDSAEWRFNPTRGTDTGTELHKAMEQFAWYTTPEDAETFIAAHGNTRTLFSHGEICDKLRKPDGDCLLWRERAFLVRFPDGDIGSGSFDRVVIRLENGCPVSAEIMDYKTDKTQDPEIFLKNYSAQMDMYRRALSVLLDLPQEKIGCTLLAVTPGKAISAAEKNL